MEWSILAVSILVLIAALPAWRARRSSVRRYRFLAPGLTILGVILFAVAAYLVWYNHRPQPADLEQTLFQGVTYTRESRTEPQPMVIHVLRIDLAAPGIGFTVTPPDPSGGRQLQAQTTSHFLSVSGVQIAVNAGFFEPWWSNSPFDYYPHVGDPVDLLGFGSFQGTVYGKGTANDVTLYFSQDERVSIGTPIGAVYNALAGNTVLLRHGQIIAQTSDQYLVTLHPRTAAGLDADSRHLILMIIDGRQPNYSEGATLEELAGIMQEYGAEDAINLDGGGSSTMVIQGADSQPVVLNSPIDNRIPGRERPIANHLGIFAQPLPS